MQETDLDDIFARITGILSEQARSGLELHDRVLTGKSGAKKPEHHLYGKKEVAIGRRKAQKTYVAGVVLQKHFVGVYLMPMYSHPDEVAPMHPDLIRAKKGKSCLNVTALDPKITADIKRMLRIGISRYRKEGWI